MQLYLFRNILGFFLLYNIQQKTPKNTIVNYVMLYVTNYVNIIKIFLPKKHKMVKYNQKNAKKYYCKLCDVIRNKLREYNKNLLTKKT